MCVQQLIAITHEIYKAFHCSPSFGVRGVFLDISKAFDKVWHDGLLYKLKRNSINGDLLILVESFLSDRYQSRIRWTNLQEKQNCSWGSSSVYFRSSNFSYLYK